MITGSPLSVTQERLWVLERLHLCNPAHNVSYGLRLTGPLDIENFQRAWSEVVQQYGILRTEFQATHGVPRAVAVMSRSPQLSARDLEGVSRRERELSLSQSACVEARRPFDLSSAPLLRASLWRLTPSENVLLVVAHRIVCDEASLKVLLREVALRYEVCENGKPWAAAEPLVQYSDFVSRQGRVSEDQVSYWKQQLAGVPASLDLPIDCVRPAEQAFSGASHAFSIGKSVLEQLRNLGNNHGTTLFVTLLAAFKVLLSRYSRQDDVVVGTRVSGRRAPEFERVIGPLENMLALRTDLSGNPSFADLVNRVREGAEAAFCHQDIPFEVLLEQLPLDRDLSRNPLFQVTFQLGQGHVSSCWSPGVKAVPFEIESGTERFDLSLDLAELSDSIEGKLSYNTDLFETTTIVRMTEHFCALVAGVADEPSRRVFDIPLLDESERSKILVEFNATARDYRRDLCMHDFFEEQAERTPDLIALICQHERLTYSELNARANQLAHYLRTQGVGPEVLVGICFERSPEMLVAVLGVLKAGGAYVPLDPTYPRNRLAAILEDARAPILLTMQSLASVLPNHAARVVCLDADGGDISGQPMKNPGRNVTASNLGYVLFTSGSTGRPKGVALEHSSAATFIQWAREVFLPDEVAGTLFSTSICFDLSIFEIFVPLSMGGTVIIAENALALPRLTAAREVTLINTVPSAIAELVRLGGVPPSVKVVNLAGEALTTSLAQRIYDKTNVRKVYNLYGPTEDTTYSTYTLVPRGAEVTIGRPLPNTQAYILDETHQPLPIGVPGELYLAGEGLARGYFGREDLTRERFVPNPFAKQSAARMYRTGDLARFLADGEIQYLGRIDNQVKLRGFRIELGEIEAVLAKHPSVQSVVVIVREDTPGDKALVAYVVPSGSSISSAELKDLVRQRLPEYMVPSVFIEMSALPLSPNGKMNRRLLPAPDWSTAEGRDVVKPRNELEATLVQIWQSVLRVPSIGVRDNFFDLGGHSLMAARLLSEVEKITGKELPLSALFRGATVESLARLITQLQDLSDPVVMQIQRGDNRRLPFFAIVPPGEESLGYAILARHMGAEQTVYKIQGSAPIVGGKRPYSQDEMQALTDEYIAAMRSVQPRGPYCLGGLCDGTHIAEQIVLGLEAQGDKVGLFAIFDTWVLQHSQSRWLWKIHYFSQRLRELERLSLAARFASFRRVARNKVDHLVGRSSARTDWRQAYWPEGFTPPRFRAPVMLFKRPRQPFYYIKDPQMGWGLRSEGGVEIYEVDFHHQEILREPHVREFGEKLGQAMQGISQPGPKPGSQADDQQGSPVTVSVQHTQRGS
ncbi:MAG TPA: amino acid adenylation domain-containing protein [Candidatus Acidoferrum sp.]|nr:amino acid adenylation domain-containing protein [Candidatus Acidoferrum sp.]